jgi:hypothetical protein
MARPAADPWSAHHLWYFFRSIPKTTVGACAAVLGGAALAVLMGTILIQDFFQSPIVLEGRVLNVRTLGKHNTKYVADIAGRTVKVTTPVYDRLKFLPVVRVEVGRGSDYVYRIEYLANLSGMRSGRAVTTGYLVLWTQAA